jgi:hypothetical protein
MILEQFCIADVPPLGIHCFVDVRTFLLRDDTTDRKP